MPGGAGCQVTAEELDFILNSDIQYRFGRDTDGQVD